MAANFITHARDVLNAKLQLASRVYMYNNCVLPCSDEITYPPTLTERWAREDLAAATFMYLNLVYGMGRMQRDVVAIQAGPILCSRIGLSRPAEELPNSYGIVCYLFPGLRR